MGRETIRNQGTEKEINRPLAGKKRTIQKPSTTTIQVQREHSMNGICTTAMGRKERSGIQGKDRISIPAQRLSQDY